MKGVTQRLLVSIAIITVSGCNETEFTTTDSLVGADRLLPQEVLAAENIQISRTVGGGFGSPFHMLSYELDQHDALIVTHLVRGAFDEDKLIDREEFQLSGEAAQKVRKELWRLRPSEFKKLDSLGWPTRPAGCERTIDHDNGEISVFFWDDGQTPGQLEDDLVAVFELPYRSSCDNETAKQARSLIKTVITSFPTSRVAAGFAAGT